MRVGRGATYPMPAQDTAICDASLQRANSETARQAQEELGAVFIAEAASGVVSALSRYETKIERGLFRKLKELRRMQATHVGEVPTALPPSMRSSPRIAWKPPTPNSRTTSNQCRPKERTPVHPAATRITKRTQNGRVSDRAAASRLWPWRPFYR